jgi:hypothetical protein
MAYRACQKSKAPKLPRSGSNNIPSASEIRTEEGKLYLFVAIDRTSKVAFARLFDKANTAAARAFLEQLIEPFPTRSKSCSPITAFNSPTCPKTDRERRLGSEAIPSIAPAPLTRG